MMVGDCADILSVGATMPYGGNHAVHTPNSLSLSMTVCEYSGDSTHFLLRLRAMLDVSRYRAHALRALALRVAFNQSNVNIRSQDAQTSSTDISVRHFNLCFRHSDK